MLNIDMNAYGTDVLRLISLAKTQNFLVTMTPKDEILTEGVTF